MPLFRIQMSQLPIMTVCLQPNSLPPDMVPIPVAGQDNRIKIIPCAKLEQFQV